MPIIVVINIVLGPRSPRLIYFLFAYLSNLYIDSSTNNEGSVVVVAKRSTRLDYRCTVMEILGEKTSLSIVRHDLLYEDILSTLPSSFLV